MDKNIDYNNFYGFGYSPYSSVTPEGFEMVMPILILYLNMSKDICTIDF